VDLAAGGYDDIMMFMADAESGFKPKAGPAAAEAGPAGPRPPRQSHKLSAA